MRLAIVCVLLVSSPAPAEARPTASSRVRAAHGRYRQHLQRGRAQLRQYRATQDARIWVKGRRNRAIASRIKARGWRWQAASLVTQAKQLAPSQPGHAASLRRRASRLSAMAQRLTAATRRYEGDTRTYLDDVNKWNARTDNRALGDPVARLYYTQTPAHERDRLSRQKPRKASERVTQQRLRLEMLSGTKTLTPAEVRTWLAQLPGDGRKKTTRTTEVSGVAVTWTIARSGKSKLGKPEGYVRTTATNPRTDEQTTMLFGTSAAWVRRRHGDSETVMVLRHRASRDRAGNTLLPAGTMQVATREVLRDSARVSVLTETLNGGTSERMLTYRPDRVERFSASSDGVQFSEQRVRQDAAGWRSIDKYWDGQALHVARSDSSGTNESTTRSAAASERLFGRLQKLYKRSPTMARHGNNRWIWREATFSGANVGTVRAQGQRGELGRITSSYLSALGTRFGAVTNVRRGHVKPASGKPSRVFTPAAAQATAQASPKRVEADRTKAARAEALVNAVRKAPLSVLLDASAGDKNAFAQPWGNTVFGRAGPRGSHMQAFRNGDTARIDPSLTRESIATLVGVLFHEGAHERQAPSFTSGRTVAPDVRARNFADAGRPLAATVSSLISADINRTHERGADKRAGKGLGQVRKLTGNPAFTPVDLAKFLRGTYPSPSWTPHDRYDSVAGRTRALNRAYKREISRP